MSVLAPDDAGARAQRRSIVTLHVAFVLSGAVTYVNGALIPDLSARFHLPYSTLASLFVVQFISNGIGATFSNHRLRGSVVFGYALIAVGMAGLTLGWPTMLVASACLGLGTGLSIPATNVTVARVYYERRGAVLNRLNLLWGAGAAGCQVLFLVLDQATRADVAPWILSLGGAGCALAAWRWVQEPPPAPPRAGSALARAGAWRLALVLLAAQLLLYTGTEATVAGWLNALCAQAAPAHSNLPFLVGVLFWAALLAGRAAAPSLLERLTEARLHAGSLALAAVGLVVLGSTSSLVSYGLGAVLLGAGLAPIYALLASLVVGRTEGSKIAGVVFASGGVGPALLPWLTGQLAGTGGSIRVGFLVPATAIVLMALLLHQYRRLG